MEGEGEVSRPPPGNWKSLETPPLEITDSTIIHQNLLQRNERHLQQAKLTPFAQGVGWNAIGWDANGSVIEDILKQVRSRKGN